MFDTVTLKARPVYIDSEILSQLNAKSVTFLSKETGALSTSYTIYDEQLPFIKYIESSQTLHDQVSIPKFLYGDNVSMLVRKMYSYFSIGYMIGLSNYSI